MRDAVSEYLLSQLSDFLADKMALHFPRERWRDLAYRAASAAKAFGFEDPQAFIRRLVSTALSKDQMEVLANHFTIAETYFWREPDIFEALQDHILPERLRLRENGAKRLRIWSAGCATGEEPFSLAILLRRTLPSIEQWQVSILATDINPRALRKAARGVYRAWSFRNAPVWLQKEYFFQRSDGLFEIIPQVRNMVSFAYLNLAQDLYPSVGNNTNAMDLIFCRNVLMYFTPERAAMVGRNIYEALVDGGWLIVGASELSLSVLRPFAPVQFQAAMGYRKPTGDFRAAATFEREERAYPETDARPVEITACAPVSMERPLQSPLADIGLGEAPDVVQSSACTIAADPQADPPNGAPLGQTQDRGAPPAAAPSIRRLANQGRLTAALDLSEQLIAADKLNPGLYYLRATILQEQHRESEAIASFRRSLYLDPDFVLAHFSLGILLARKRNRKAARKCFDNALALLTTYRNEEILPESDGITAARFREIIQATVQAEGLTRNAA